MTLRRLLIVTCLTALLPLPAVGKTTEKLVFDLASARRRGDKVAYKSTMAELKGRGTAARAELMQLMRDGPLAARATGLFVLDKLAPHDKATRGLIREPGKVGEVPFQPPIGWWAADRKTRDAYADRVPEADYGLGPRTLAHLCSPSAPGDVDALQLAVFSFATPLDRDVFHDKPVHLGGWTARKEIWLDPQGRGLILLSRLGKGESRQNEMRLYFDTGTGGTIMLVLTGKETRWTQLVGQLEHARPVLKGVAETFGHPERGQPEVRSFRKPTDPIVPRPGAMGTVGLVILQLLLFGYVFRHWRPGLASDDPEARDHALALYWMRANFVLFLITSFMAYHRSLWVATVFIDIALGAAQGWLRSRTVNWHLLGEEEQFLNSLRWMCIGVLVTWTLPWWYFHFTRDSMTPEDIEQYTHIMMVLVLPMVTLPTAGVVFMWTLARRWIHS